MDFTAPVTCAICGRQSPRTGMRQQFCAPCAKRRAVEQRRQWMDNQRRTVGAWKVGTPHPCPQCGTPVIYCGGSPKYCPPCKRRASSLNAYRSFLRRPLDERRGLRNRMRDNYDFDGNRIKALERDGFQCVRCGGTRRLSVHHKDGKGLNVPRSKRNNRLRNLETLCTPCHTRHHKAEQ